MANLDWKEIENELNGLMPSIQQGGYRLSPDHSIRRAIQADEEALLAHIADALAREERY